MPNKDLLPLLIEAGLHEKEAQIYFAGIELGESSILQLAEQAGIKRPTAYEIMEELEKKGLFSVSPRGKKRLFLAENPEHVLAILKAREKSFIEALPELQMLYHTGGNKPKVRFYEGVEGLKAMYWDTLESKETILVYNNITEMWGAIPKDFKKTYVKERVRRKIFDRCICSATAETMEYSKKDKEELREMVFVPKDRFNFKNEINIYNDKVAIFSFPEKIGVIIESKKIAETQKMIFQLAWLGALQAV
jgi:HTH-type transcriptional regulator, sugar sensing transcriptional regulator